MTWPPGAGPHRVLIDTSAYYAFADREEGRHGVALAIRRRITSEDWFALTTNFVLAETHALVLRRLGRTLALRFLDSVEHSAVLVVHITEADEARARQILHQYVDKDFSLTDAASFAVMERLRIPYAFTFDRNFIQYGLAVLTPT